MGYGNIHPCGVKDGKVYYDLPSGHRTYFETALDIEIPIQVNLFISDTVMFLLFHDDKMYVGRNDQSISIYRTSDLLLVGLSYWKPPKYAETKLCGYYNNRGDIYEIHLDLKDRRTLYICSLSKQSVLDKPIDCEFDLDAALVSASAFGLYDNYHIFKKGGEPVVSDVWTIQEDVRKQNCRIFL